MPGLNKSAEIIDVSVSILLFHIVEQQNRNENIKGCKQIDKHKDDYINEITYRREVNRYRVLLRYFLPHQHLDRGEAITLWLHPKHELK